MVDEIEDPSQEEVAASGRQVLTAQMRAGSPGDVDEIERLGRNTGRRLGLVYDIPEPVDHSMEKVRIELLNLNTSQQLVINKLLAHFAGACRDSESGYWDLDGVGVKLMDNGMLIVENLDADQHATGPNKGGPMSLLAGLIRMGVSREVLHEAGVLNVRFPLKKMECLTFRDLEHLFGSEVAVSLADAILKAGGNIEAQEDDAVPSENGELIVEPEVNAGGDLATIAEPLEDDFEWRVEKFSLATLFNDYMRLNQQREHIQNNFRERAEILQSQMRLRVEKYLESLLGISNVGIYSDGEDAVGTKPELGSWDLSGAEVEVDVGKNRVIVRGINQNQRTDEDVRICDALKKCGVEITSISENGRFSCVFDLGEVERVLRKKV